MSNVPHLPVLRLGRSYESLDKLEIKDHRSGEVKAVVSTINAGILRKDFRKLGEARAALKKFSVEQLPSWAKVNAPMILFPFLREQVYALTARCGYNPIILPMIHVPTIRLEQVEKQTPPSEISEERAFVQL